MAVKQSSAQVTSAIDLFGKSKDIVMRNLQNFAILMALPALAALFSTFHRSGSSSRVWSRFNIFDGTLPAYSIVGIVGLSIIFFILASLLALVIQAMLTGLELEGADGKTPAFGHLWQIGKKYWLRLFGLAIMVGLYFVLAAAIGLVILLPLMLVHLTSLGLFIFGVWAIIAFIFIIQHYYLAPYVMVDQDKPIFDAMSISSTLAKNNAWAIWSVILFGVVLGLTGVVPLIGPIISFTLGALYAVAPALRYLELKKLA